MEGQREMEQRTSFDIKRKKRQRSYWILFALLSLVVLCGFPAIWYSPKAYVYLFGISGFSIAYAIHFFSISIGINGVLLRSEQAQPIVCRICDVEHAIVGHGLGVLGGGLGILFSGGILLLLTESKIFGIPWICKIFWLLKLLTMLVYLAGALGLVINVWRYYFYPYEEPLRRWPTIIQKICGLPPKPQVGSEEGRDGPSG